MVYHEDCAKIMAQLRDTILVFLLFQLIVPVHVTTIFEFKLVSYCNTGHELINGTCCDDPSGPCTDRCDNRFTVCLDSNTTNDSFDSCDYDLIEVGEVTAVSDTDNFIFPLASSGYRRLSIDSPWMGSFQVKVQIWDVDPGSADELVNEIFRTVEMAATPFSITPPLSILNVGTRTRLSFTPKVQCATDFYDSDCLTKCVAQDDLSGHYTCNISTGAKLCLDGWTGDDCDEDYDECSSDPCLNGAQCINGSNEYTCTCLEGYTGLDCETDVDDCATMPCENNGTCLDLVNDFNCTCAPGYYGITCDTEIDECQSDPCQNNGTCMNEINSFDCTCVGGYEGTTCEIEVDECEHDPCLNNATCIDGEAQFHCLCVDGYDGEFCQNDINECAVTPCRNNGTCQDWLGNFTCICAGGFEGYLCEIDIDECLNQPCYNNATCVDKIGGFQCQCQEGFSGTLCDEETDECASDPCQHNSTCEDQVNGFFCICADGYNGTHCDNDFDDCASSPCSNNSTCVDEVSSFRCECLPGFEGSLCDVDTDECMSAPCVNNATCEDALDGYVCHCAPGFGTTNCEVDLDDCLTAPCRNNGTCEDLIDNYQCVCTDGFTGDDCGEDVDECASSPCENGGSCEDILAGFICHCPYGYDGYNCSQNMDECQSEPCLNNATCVDGIGHFTCQCLLGFNGTKCEMELDACSSLPCMNSGTCQDTNNGYRCLCLKGYEGETCSEETNFCSSSPCNAGMCIPEFNGYRCDCDKLHTGKHCETVNPDPCSVEPCVKGKCEASTTDDRGYECLCDVGYFGRDCELALSIYGYIIIVIGTLDSKSRFELGMASILETSLLQLEPATVKRDALPVIVTVATLGDLLAVPSGTELSEVTFVASRDGIYMTSERIGELLSNKTKESIEAEIGYEIYDGDTEKLPDWLSMYWYVVVIGVASICLCTALIIYIIKRLQSRDKVQEIYGLKDDLEMDAKDSHSTDSLFHKSQPIIIENPYYLKAITPVSDTDSEITSYIYELLSNDDYTPVYLKPSFKEKSPEKLVLESIENYS